MSYVTNAMFSPGVLEPHYNTEKFVHCVASTDEARGQTFRLLNDEWTDYGGTKYLERDVWVAAFNYVPPSVLKRALASVDWESSHEAQLFICDQEDEGWSVVSAAEAQGNADARRREAS